MSRSHHHHKHHQVSQDDSTDQYDQVYAGDFNVKKEVETDKADEQMNVYVDKEF